MALELGRKGAEKVVEKPMPILGTDGIVIAAMTNKQKVKNNFIWRGDVYHAWALESLDAYSRATVVGYDEQRKHIKIVRQLPHFLYPDSLIFEDQPHAIISQDNPENGKLYIILNTTKNVRIKSIFARIIWTVQPLWLQVVVTKSKTATVYNIDSPDSNIPYFACVAADELTEELLVTTDDSGSRAFLTEDRSIKVGIRCSGGTVTNISSIVKWSKIP